MNLLTDKSSRNFLTAIAVSIVIISVFDIVSAVNIRNCAKQFMTERDNAVTSALIENGTSESLIAEAMTSTETSAEAAALLGKLGIGEEASPRFLPYMQTLAHAQTASVLIKALLLIILFAGSSAVFILKRERLFLNAAETVAGYSGSIFTDKLPGGGDGAVYVLFDRINNMASSLKSKQESEQNTKEFLKNIISDISHQLKTPLAALSTYTEIILDEPENTEAVRTFAEKSEAAEERMKTLISSILKIAKLDAGGIEFTADRIISI